jgi:hypothetical protein
MSIFEICMLICFGVSWPLSIAKTIKTKTVTGKSILFLIIVILGYACGILHKVMYSMDCIIYLYIANLVLVAIDLGLCIYYSSPARNKKRMGFVGKETTIEHVPVRSGN